ncbi:MULTISPECIES: branched-chain amino acid transport system II carrier protein [unclassified Clostridioides]|uniref:branched-chain amino acid transport system II carrier protein n=1 Tax=unclassified Clostridioides TaxID=2635829 RepID=UPI001D1306B0|nr:branched-chain amino acid transport system II carrier protein [Clostridioides sp. ZZV14-6150]MCC0659738.1 branched-chain amino acid transport system II carrier protein [Clostridioides sp. ZZV14-6154]MCC0666747.1 branched-chain amino acid transport system II carrier protein [Clostridioides sp. ZZV14-6153]MCC0717769.1 branched-chain amino acid transport system II carrier protein [Clostridioides sp. ZZV14-6105]MCC0722868.1 branched-chain amino acid transport system II carrier protein [Clostridi
MGEKQIKFKDVIVIGFALFAMFFGAGNLIFPPYLGVLSGSSWLVAFIGFLFADGGLALLAVIAATKFNGDTSKMFSRAGKGLSIVLGCAMVICIGPLLAIPRTAATTYEMGILPTIGSGISPVIFSIVFFAIVLVLTIRPSKVVDIVGSILTPALLIALAVLIVKGIVSPLGDIRDASLIQNVFSEGITQGYQTMDALAASVFASIIIMSVISKGYTGEKEKMKATVSAGVIAVIGMALVYGGLCYLGATVSEIYGQDVQQTALIVSITAALLGNTGKILLAIIVALACLTTAIGLSSAAGQYFSTLTNGKLKYEHIVIVVCVFSAIISNFGVSTIIKFSSPILSMVYPATITLVILALFSNQIKNDNVFKCAAYMALLVSVLTVATSFGVNIPLVNSLPLASLGFNWVVPVLIAGIIGNFIPSQSSKAVQ